MAVRGKEINALDYVPQGNQPVSYKQFRRVLSQPAVAAVSEREFQNEAEYAAFMEEEIVLLMHPTSDLNAEPFVPVGCNGEQIWLPRGVPISIPRKFVESLTGLQVTYRTERVQDPNAEEGYVQRTRMSMPYPFQVVTDRNPKGKAWLERVLRGG